MEKNNPDINVRRSLRPLEELQMSERWPNVPHLCKGEK